MPNYQCLVHRLKSSFFVTLFLKFRIYSHKPNPISIKVTHTICRYVKYIFYNLNRLHLETWRKNKVKAFFFPCLTLSSVEPKVTMIARFTAKRIEEDNRKGRLCNSYFLRTADLCRLKNNCVDPWHFGTDPDPGIRINEIRIRIRGSVSMRHGSGSGSCSFFPKFFAIYF